MKKLVTTAAIAAAALTLAACSGTTDEPTTDAPETTDEGTDEGTGDAGELIEVRVGASPTPHAEILEFVQDNLAEEAGITITITEFTDYVLPNEALDAGDIDANYFQHIPFFESTVAEQGFEFSHSPGIHIEPFGVYSESIASIDELEDGAQVSIPNDPSNGGRALLLLAAEGVIGLDEGIEGDPTIDDIAENPKNIEIVELEAPQLPLTLQDVDAAVINGNFALDAGLIPTQDAIVLESGEDNPYVNIVAYRTADENSEGITTLIELLTSEEVREFITTTWPNGELIPAF